MISAQPKKFSLNSRVLAFSEQNASFIEKPGWGPALHLRLLTFRVLINKILKMQIRSDSFFGGKNKYKSVMQDVMYADLQWQAGFA